MDEISKRPEVKAKLLEALYRRWKNPEYRAHISRIMSDIMTAKMTDPIARQVYDLASQRLWQDPEFRERHRKAMKRRWNDREYRDKITGMMKEKWADPVSRKEILRLIRKGISEYWADPEKVARRLESITPEQKRIMSEIHREVATRLWSDPEYREMMLNSGRRTWKRRGYEDFRSEFLPTYSGFRRDIGYNAKSCWEANIARILIFSGRKFTRNVPLELEIEEGYEGIISPGNSTFFVDFLSEDKRGKFRIYEIIAHYFENPVGIAKAEMLLHQYPNMPITIIDQKVYSRFRKLFRDRINSDSRFVAWEETGHNIKTNLEDFV